MSAIDRKSKQFWAVTDDHQIQFVTGYECQTKEQWWVPELGYAMTVGYHLFVDKEKARQRALKEIVDFRELLKRQEKSLCKL